MGETPAARAENPRINSTVVPKYPRLDKQSRISAIIRRPKPEERQRRPQCPHTYAHGATGSSSPTLREQSRNKKNRNARKNSGSSHARLLRESAVHAQNPQINPAVMLNKPTPDKQTPDLCNHSPTWTRGVISVDPKTLAAARPVRRVHAMSSTLHTRCGRFRSNCPLTIPQMG